MDLFRTFKNFRNFRRLSPPQRHIVFYAESGQDWHHFEPIITYLTRKLSKTVCYVSSDPKDPGLHVINDKLLPFFIKEGIFRTLLFQVLRADVMVLTMLDLHNFELRRSVHPVHYIYIWHGMGSTHLVDHENSYDHYDSIFCVGPHQIEEIRRREKLKHLPAKNLVRHGYARLEQLMRERRDHVDRVNPKTMVLIAPTWGENSITNLCAKELIEILLEAKFKVVLRPHYHSRRLTPQVLDGLIDQFKEHPDFSVIEQMGEKNSLFESNLMICDWSSAAVEYAFGLEKPVLFIDVPQRKRNPNYEELGIESIEVFIRDKIGTILSPKELKAAPQRIETLLNQSDNIRDRIRKLRREFVFNLGNSAKIAAQEIVKIAAQESQNKRQ